FFSRVEIAASSNRSPRVIDSSGPARSEPNGTRIYSHADSDVVLPRVVYPKLPDLPKGVRAEDLTILELVIGVDGLVERADLRSIPRDVHEFMLVSAAKAWQFAPATVDGQPVRFRYRIHLALQ
ncbi:MAG TPA: hypothetical protein VD833_26880, partial [Vicinamibacterales bacterium]|nr:hypothetical protein [Vicinamibacterales bacterium]